MLLDRVIDMVHVFILNSNHPVLRARGQIEGEIENFPDQTLLFVQRFKSFLTMF